MRERLAFESWAKHPALFLNDSPPKEERPSCRGALGTPASWGKNHKAGVNLVNSLNHGASRIYDNSETLSCLTARPPPGIPRIHCRERYDVVSGRTGRIGERVGDVMNLQAEIG
jgi:hypothetical protein